MLRLLTPRRAAVAGVLGMALLGAACSSNDAGTTGTQTPAASPTTAAPMTASGPFGAACSAVPASGVGSLEAESRRRALRYMYSSKMTVEPWVGRSSRPWRVPIR